ncbi:hypothetical protein [Mycobacteroides abscessus]|uniref:hypothetical protein n=1 Tax=Mycobacteroides abscessus TaxID=36809 RepID=UPI0009D48E16|nr:hypothetical protein [Mycobacteroides abscessus]SKG97186.1 Uncharacterised protein [Mycobacteroides abscessus subsp. massiliense]SKH55732.1 Uncharacterised protein [Mycobacteroides abscessus subsp. massiliense]SKI08313.1 Uncharacterised protein [Mycobacteroides abscessus subsp. massiliense]SKJ38775.1 Uncharacterised protein [Mycobacteroides abscessus subsp. massiliense]SKJ83894.1 Uncharacterised protein [Mycobacteroides abscessus subsp. massiliense]
MAADRFSLIVERARAAEYKAKEAWGKTKDQLQDDIERAAARREELETKTDKAAAKASSSWSELSASWEAQIAKIKTALGQWERTTDARRAAREADIAESDAACAVDIALSAIEEAEDTVLYAVYARRYAEEVA